MRILLALAVAMLVTACEPPRAALVLDPDSLDVPRWPLPPDEPRLIFSRALIGDSDFFEEKDSERKTTAADVLRWIAGILTGHETPLELRRPVNGFVDSDGRIFVADASQGAVMVFDVEQKRVLRWDEAAQFLNFISPVGVTSDGQGGVYVSDSELDEVFHLDFEGKPINRFGKKILNRPSGIAREPVSGDIYVADVGAHDIKVFTADGKLANTFGSNGSREGEFNAPTNLTFDRGQLFVVDTLNFRVQVLTPQGDHQLAFGRLGLYVGNLTRPKGVALSRTTGAVFVVESFYDHLLAFSREGEFLMSVGGTGQGVGQFYLPAGAWTDAEGRLYVADMFNGRVMVFKEYEAHKAAVEAKAKAKAEAEAAKKKKEAPPDEQAPGAGEKKS